MPPQAAQDHDGLVETLQIDRHPPKVKEALSSFHRTADVAVGHNQHGMLCWR